MKFTYRWGQRPLEGYTIKRGLGHGGFGEVYFAVSDGGKEVALKLIRGHTDTELRGIANCLNLKHPNLVHLYDLQSDAQGDRWLAMEYVQGESLGGILHRQAHGLPEAQAREWFLQAASAVAYLHDHAVVHRDIKPANIFVENGMLKLGDYGLSKSVGASQHAQSSNVGTIHYMAPEVASGSYSKQIDIYACGVMLYEMLTGEVPFKGESWAEIAIKHQTDLPDMSKVPSAYIAILERALNKKADRRFADMNEMIRAVEAIGKPMQALRQPNRISEGIPIGQAVARPIVPLTTNRTKIGELASALMFSPIPALPATAIWAMFTGTVNWGVLGVVFLLMLAVSWAVLFTAKIWEGRDSAKPRRLALASLGVLIGFGAFWLDGWRFPDVVTHDEATPPGLESYWGGVLRMEPGGLEVLSGYVVFFVLALAVPRWWMAVQRKRNERFTLYPVIASGIWGLILLVVWSAAGEPERGRPLGAKEKWSNRPTDFKEFWGNREKKNATDGSGQRQTMPPGYLVLVLAGAAASVQLVSPWRPPSPVTKRFRRRFNPSAER